jgi:hypothetical protein
MILYRIVLMQRGGCREEVAVAEALTASSIILPTAPRILALKSLLA